MSGLTLLLTASDMDPACEASLLDTGINSSPEVLDSLCISCSDF